MHITTNGYGVRNILNEFSEYFGDEMEEIDDKDLQQEMDILGLLAE